MRNKKRKGFTLIEAMISLMLLGIMSISILTMSTYGVKYAKWNNIRLTALNLAYSQVEWIKTLDYKKIGLNITGYSPQGEVEPNSYMNNIDSVEIEGVKYKISTNIIWEKAISNTGEPDPEAIKKIDVTVEAIDLNSGKMKEYAVLGALVSQESARKFSEPGHIVTTVYLRSYNNPIKNVKVGLGKGRTYSQFTNTDQYGKALLGNIKSGEYIIEPLSWNYKPLMVMPNAIEIKEGKEGWKVSKNVVVPKLDKSKGDQMQYPKEDFLIDLPGNINITDKDKYPPNIIFEIKPSGDSHIPVEGEDPDHMLLTAKIHEINDIKFWRSWNYEYDVSLGEESFLLVDNDTNELWDGRFDITDIDNESIINIYLAFGLEEGTVIGDPNQSNEIKEIIIEFTSNIKNPEDIEYELNGVEITKDLYSITTIENGKNKKFKIIFNETIENTNEMNFEIINYENIINNYYMSLSQNKNKILLNIQE